MLRQTLASCALATLAAVFCPAQAADTPKPAEKKGAPRDLVLKGDAKCTTCHDENDSPKVLAIGKTRHGVTADERAPTCTSCHGDSKKHETEAGTGDKKAPPADIGFGAKSKTPATERNAACLTCHQDGPRIHWQSGVHANRDLSCTSCHKIHAQDDAVRVKQAQAEVCFNCHKEQRAQVNRVSHHPIPEGKMTCSSCHDVHGDSPKQLTKISVNETCYSCHTEKRGPFVHNHEPVNEDCSICHQPHGTNIPALLKSRPPMLCVSCHGPSSHPSQPPALPVGTATLSANNTSRIMGTVARGCLNCHTNIHGGNSTQNNVTVERFRR